MINYELLSKCIKRFKHLGYEQVEVDWAIHKDWCNITKPKDKLHIKVDYPNQKDMVLVGSAEQSLIKYCYEQGVLSNTKLVACTPCFRDEQYDELHKFGFMKVELMIWCPSKLTSFGEDNVDHQLQLMICNALGFMKNYTKGPIRVVETDIGYDIELNGIEVGSYGYREKFIGKDKINWIYGTGIAEPRFSTVNNAIN